MVLELEGGGKKERLENGDRVGHGPKMSRNAPEDFLKQHYQLGLGIDELIFLGGEGGGVREYFYYHQNKFRAPET
jgi:hypothetical protein